MSSAPRRALSVLLVTLVAALGVVATAGPAAAAGPDAFDFRGHGNGHGRGLGQFGAKGYAEAGQTTDQILDHFYGGTTAGSRDPGTPVRVLLCDLESVTVCSNGTGVQQIVVTSGAAMSIEGVGIAGGQAIRVTRDATGFVVEQAPGGCSATAWTAIGGGHSADTNIDIDSSVGNPGDDKTKMLELCGPKHRTYRGVFDFTIDTKDGNKPRLVNFLGIDGYLKGVVPSEMPSTWAPAALRAQAIAARSYALSGDTRFTPTADTCDTTQCQVYLGVSGEAATTNQAIADTAGVVRLMTSNGTVARTEFSSSTGGYTAGGTFPAVIDEGDSVQGNPHHTWTVTINDDQIEAAYPQVGDVQKIEVTQRNGLGEDGGRVKQVKLTGASGNITVTGDDMRGKLGLRSDWWTPSASAGSGTPPPPKVLGWVTRTSASAGPPTGNVSYGAAGYVPISCDWNNDGTDTLGVYVNGTWYLRDDLSAGAPTRTFDFGAAGYTPVCGDWNGDGQDSIGVYANGTWYLRNNVGPGAPDITLAYGYTGATPVVGNWDGKDRAVEIGVYDSGTWYLRNDVGQGPPAQTISYGYPGVYPVIGDWNGDGVDGIGVYDSGSWLLRETATPGSPSRIFSYGYAGTYPMPGHWSPSADGVGIIELR